MANFARIDKNTKEVLQVHVVNNEDCFDVNGFENEYIGIAFLNKVHSYQEWIKDVEFIQTSYNAKIRKNFAGIGYKYDVRIDAFVAPKEFDSWVLNDIKGVFDPPSEYPKDGKNYVWDEKNLTWIIVNKISIEIKK